MSTVDTRPLSASLDAAVGTAAWRGWDCWALVASGFATNAAAPAAAPFRKLRRPTEAFLDFIVTPRFASDWILCYTGGRRARLACSESTEHYSSDPNFNLRALIPT